MILAGDIGGTKTHLALYEERGSDSTASAVYSSAAYGSLQEIIWTFLEEAGATPTSACFGIAGPVQNRRCVTTNLNWVVDANEIASMLQLAPSSLEVINDLVANAWGISALKPEDYRVLHAGSSRAQGNAAVISAGTGLGEAGMFWDGKRHHPFASEGGHADLGPRNAREFELSQYLDRKFGRVSYERVLSGPGLANIYHFLRDSWPTEEDPEIAQTLQEKQTDPAACISEAAVAENSPLCRLALEMFLEIYGAEAGNLALKMMATGGVWLGGGIAAKLASTIAETPHFMNGFTSKGQLGYLVERIPVRIILNQQTALLGAAQYAFELLR